MRKPFPFSEALSEDVFAVYSVTIKKDLEMKFFYVND